ncbi:MAG TPA: ABC transporter permease [Nitrososphaeria archaeon]|nr:ABC transporter permease [Nitrososphaeria archaeon]
MKEKGIASAKVWLFLLENAIWILIVIFYAIFAAIVPKGMLSPSMVLFIIYSCFPIGFIVIGQAICLITGNFDLSIGEIAGLTAMVGAVVAVQHILPDPLTILVPIAVGTLCGILNAILITWLGLHPFLVTLGTGFAFDGLTLIVYPSVIFKGFPEIYLAIGGDYAVAFSVFFITLLILGILFLRFRIGLRFYAVGSDPMATSMTGINVKKVIFLAYTLSGFFGGLSGLFYAGFLKSVSPLTADGTVFISFAAAVLGGISISGGRGNVVNILGGILCLSIFDYGLTMIKVSPYVRRVFYGVLVVVALIVDKARAKIRDRYMKSLREMYGVEEF